MAFFDPANRAKLRDEANQDTQAALAKQRQEEDRQKKLKRDSLQAQIKRLQDEARRAEARANLLKTELQSIERTERQKETGASSIEAKKVSEEHRVLELERQLRAQETQLRSVEMKENALRRDVDKLSGDITAAVAKEGLDKHADESRLSQELIKVRTREGTEGAEKLRLDREVEKLRRDLAAKEALLTDLEHKILEDKKEAQELATKVKEKPTKTYTNKTQGKGRLERERRDLEKVETEKNEKAEKVKDLKAEIEMARDRLRSAEFRVPSRESGSSFQKKLSRERELQTLESTLTKTHQELANLERELQTLH